MEIIKCGSRARPVLLKSLIGIVTAANIRFEKVEYELSYFTGNEYKQIWLNASELEIIEGETIKIGYK